MERDEILAGLENLIRASGGLTPEVKMVELKEQIMKEKGGLSEKTVENYRWVFSKLEKYQDNWFRSPGEVNEFLASLKGLGDESILNVFKTLRAIGRYTKKTYGWADPTENARRPKVSKKNRRYFSKEELAAIAGACREGWEKALILVLLDSSARIGEVAGLKVEDLSNNSFKVKGKTGARRYRCDPRVIALMRGCAVDGVVFPMMNSRRNVIRPARVCSGEILNDRVNVIMKRAGLKGEKLGPHTLRHTAASLVASKTMSGLAVKALLQHDDIATSMLYIHDAEDKIQQEVSPLELSGLNWGGGNRQITMGEVRALPEKVDINLETLVRELMPVVKEGIKVRPALSSDDLNLIREGMVKLMVAEGEVGSGSRCVQLMRRILRKV